MGWAGPQSHRLNILVVWAGYHWLGGPIDERSAGNMFLAKEATGAVTQRPERDAFDFRGLEEAGEAWLGGQQGGRGMAS